MGYLYIFVAMLCYGCGSIISELYNRKVKTVNPFLYTALVSLVVLFFNFCCGGFTFRYNGTTLMLGCAFGIVYCLCTVSLLMALKIGYVSLTSLIYSYSMILPTLFGLVAYGVRPNAIFYVGLGFFVVSLFLLGQKKSSEEDTGKKLSWKWFVIVAVAFVTNGCCSIFQTHQQKLCDGAYKYEFMITGMAVVFVFCVVRMLFTLKKDTPILAHNLKKGWYIAVPYALTNALLNLFVMFAVALLPTNVVFPIICGGGLILTLLLSCVIFREKLNKFQIAGFALGVLAIMLMNI